MPAIKRPVRIFTADGWQDLVLPGQGVQGIQGVKGDTGPIADGVAPGSTLWSPIFAWPAVSTGALAAGVLRVTRTYITVTTVAIAFEVSTLGTTNVVAVAYRDGFMQPGTEWGESAQIDCSTTGLKTATLSIGTPGFYWIGLQNVGSASVTLRTAQGINPMLNGGSVPPAPITLANLINAWNVTGQGASIPGTFPGVGVTYVSSCPAMFLQGN